VKAIRTALLLAVVLMLLAGCGSTPSPEPVVKPSTASPVATGIAGAPALAASTTPHLAPSATSPRPTSSPTIEPTGTAKAPGQVRITVVYDNTAVDPDLAAEWGFAAWIEYGEHNVLFDTGPDGSSLLGNMEKLDLDSKEIDVVVLSHIHGDHTGGLSALLDSGALPVVYVPAAFDRSFKKLISARTKLVEVDDAVEILPGLHSTGELGTTVVEQSLVIETSLGTVVITGCAHPGILNIVGEARNLVDDEIALVVGGFHLGNAPTATLERIVEGFRGYGVKQVSPTHCTGEAAIARFAEEYGEDYIAGGAGRVYEIGDESAREPRPDGLSVDETATLTSLEMVDGYPLYTMHYYGVYAQGTSLPQAADVKWADSVPSWACSLFAALADAGNRLYGRNFDWQFSPALLLFTDPPDGYASLSMVDIGYLVPGDRVHALADLPLGERRELLSTPYWPFDGMNEHGLVVGMAAVPPGGMKPDPAKTTVDSLGIIRQILDHARDVDEAVTLFESHNVDMGGGPPLHYLLADRSGHSVLVEFYQGEMVLVPNDDPWHVATNFLLSSVRDPAEGECWRYDRIEQSLTQAQGQLGSQEAMDLLSQVSQGLTQWSVVYGLSTGKVQVAMGQQYERLHTFHLP
jgi:metal-dependent hydrolase (beta-lactamase superfamily II)